MIIINPQTLDLFKGQFTVQEPPIFDGKNHGFRLRF